MMDPLLHAGLLRDIDVQLVRALVRRYDENPPEDLQTLLALACRATGDGHVCLDLSGEGQNATPALVPAEPSPDEGPLDPAALQESLAALVPAAAGQWTAFPRLVGSGPGNEPFVMEGTRLYLRRFWNYEQNVADHLQRMARESTGRKAADLDSAMSRIDPPLAEGQQAAIRRAMETRLAIITGGPGTGKTHVAAHLLVLLAQTQPDIRIRMAAPTGKAAARMDDSVRTILTRLGVALDLEPAATLERLLGYRKNSPYFRHNRDNPLSADVVLIDETSMIDLPKMAKLLEAIGPRTQLILLGDKDQLASVEPGSVMAELCRSRALAACTTVLTENQRFRADSPVAELGQAIHDGDARQAWALVSAGSADLSIHPSRTFAAAAPPEAFATRVRSGYADFLAAGNPPDAFAALASFRVLCALRRGPLGVEAINRIIEDILLPRRRGEFYDHRVILVTRNHHDLGLYNGDVGIVLEDETGHSAVVFETGRGQFRAIPGRLLPDHETAFAMTVHKSQGSGFGRVLVLLPGQASPILTRELLYTAITRTQTGVDLWCESHAFQTAVATPTRRNMGLQDKLDSPSAQSGTNGMME